MSRAAEVVRSPGHIAPLQTESRVQATGGARGGVERRRTISRDGNSGRDVRSGLGSRGATADSDGLPSAVRAWPDARQVPHVSSGSPPLGCGASEAHVTPVPSLDGASWWVESPCREGAINAAAARAATEALSRLAIRDRFTLGSNLSEALPGVNRQIRRSARTRHRSRARFRCAAAPGSSKAPGRCIGISRISRGR
jgi:hypothetical protein